MLIEYITETDDYREELNMVNFTASNGISVDARTRKTKGQNNYILKAKTENSTLKDAIALDEAREKIERILADKNISFKMLLNESSQCFTKELYPLICEYETKLRKFIYVTLFDIDEAARATVIAQLKKAKIEIKDQDPNYDFLEYSELGDIIVFLFANDSLYKDIDHYKSDPTHRYSSKDDIIEYIKNSTQKTIWEEFFAPNFTDSIIPETIWDIKNYRNDVMHFHNVSYDCYKKALELITKGIVDLNKQIKKGVVIENTEEKVTALSSNFSYSSSFNNILSTLTNSKLMSALAFSRSAGLEAALTTLTNCLNTSYYSKLSGSLPAIFTATDILSKSLSSSAGLISNIHKYDWDKIINPLRDIDRILDISGKDFSEEESTDEEDKAEET